MRRLALLVFSSLVLASASHAAPAASWRDAMPPADLARSDRLAARVEAAYDSVRGGYVFRDGAPSESAVLLALARGGDGPGAPWDIHARRTLEWMRTFADSNGGGYYDRFPDADDPRGFIDKSTAVNARRLELLIAAWRASGDPVYRTEAARVMDFANRVLMDPRGGFVVAQVGDRELLPEPNGLMIHAWLQWAAVTGDPRVRDFALLSIDRTWSVDWTDVLGLMRVGEFGVTRVRSWLVDQAEMGRALVLAARVGGRPADRARAIGLGELMLARFEDGEKGGFRMQLLLTRDGRVKNTPREAASNARAAGFLYELARLTGDTRYRAAADRAMKVFEGQFDKLGLDGADWALATRAAWVDDLPPAPAWRAIADGEHDEPPRSRTYKTGAR